MKRFMLSIMFAFMLVLLMQDSVLAGRWKYSQEHYTNHPVSRYVNQTPRSWVKEDYNSNYNQAKRLSRELDRQRIRNNQNSQYRIRTFTTKPNNLLGTFQRRYNR